MRSEAMDERFSRMRDDRTATPAAGRVLAIAVLSCLCVTAQLEAISPPERGSSQDFRATVLDISAETERITVTSNTCLT